jgi:hypothetical protein
MMVFTLKYLRFPRLAEGFQNPSSVRRIKKLKKPAGKQADESQQEDRFYVNLGQSQ